MEEGKVDYIQPFIDQDQVQLLVKRASRELALLAYGSTATAASQMMTKTVRYIKNAQLDDQEYAVLVSSLAEEICTFIKYALSNPTKFSQTSFDELLKKVKIKPESVTTPLKDLNYFSILHYLISISNQRDVDQKLVNNILQQLIEIDDKHGLLILKQEKEILYNIL